MPVTRFNPTANGRLHIGHAYTALLNRAIGKPFILRVDDTQEHLVDRHGLAQVDRWAEGILEDFDWLGIKPDKVYRQSQEIERVEDFLNENPFNVEQFYQPRNPQFFPLAHGSDTPFYSYTPRYTFEKVVFDYLDTVDCLVRGIDLVSEFSLYCFFCDALDLPVPAHHYIPRLMVKGRGDLLPVSKTNGGYTLKEIREQGGSSYDLRERLWETCFDESTSRVKLDNLKACPTYDEGLW